MPAYSIDSVRFAGLAAVLPPGEEAIASSPGVEPGSLAKVVANTGVSFRRIAAPGVCTSDLCAQAADAVMAGCGVSRDSIDLLIFVSQTPDQVLPATACSLHGRLRLSTHCAAFDVNLGCSGYVYALSLAASYLRSGAASRALLLVGDTISKVVSPRDRSVAYLFGDAGTATLLERSEGVPAAHFVTGTDGSGAPHLQIAAGMFRRPSDSETRREREREGGNMRSDEQLAMNGPEIFNFTLREIPPLFNRVLTQARWDLAGVDAVVMHQANRFMLDHLSKRLKLPPGKAVVALERRGNTSSASIPLAICDSLRDRLAAGPARLVLAGFGVGFSWAAAALEVDRPFIAPVADFCVP